MMCIQILKNLSVLHENINVMDTDNKIVSLMTQINDNIGSKYSIINNMVSVSIYILY